MLIISRISFLVTGRKALKIIMVFTETFKNEELMSDLSKIAESEGESKREATNIDGIWYFLCQLCNKKFRGLGNIKKRINRGQSLIII